MKYDFAGYATKSGVLVKKDNRIISKDCFEHQDGLTLPLVYQHMRNDVNNIIGKATLEHREDGTYVYASFNDSANGQNAKAAVKHGDIDSMSIYAVNLVQSEQNGHVIVEHGDIREVSLVIAGANPGAKIDTIMIEHSDGSTTELDEAIIWSDDKFELDVETEVEHSEEEPEEIEHEDDDERTIGDIIKTMNEEQLNTLLICINDALGGDAQHSEEEDDDMNVFEHNDAIEKKSKITDAQVAEIFKDAIKLGSLKKSVLQHADGDEDYGIEDIELLFPDYKKLNTEPIIVGIDKNANWAEQILAKVSKSPFSRIKTIYANITADEARAKGYIKAHQKTEEVFPVFKRTTDPTTVYKKQKLDRDDILDITDMNVVAFVKKEMQIKLKEEIARAILIGDGRQADDDDKIDETKIIPIVSDTGFTTQSELTAQTMTIDALEEIALTIAKDYRGSGLPEFYTSYATRAAMLMIRDVEDRRYFKSEAELCTFLGVQAIIPLAILDEYQDDNPLFIGIAVNLKDYTTGTDRGGAVTMFDDFDIDYNQYKYLIETRFSGMLNRPYASFVFSFGDGQ